MNRWVATGRLTKDPELRNTATGTAACSFTVAVARRYVKEGQPEADFIPCVAFGRSAEFISTYFSKGKRICIEGAIQTRTWDDNDGNRHYVTECVVDHAEFGSDKQKDEDKRENAKPAPAFNPEADSESEEEEDDDLPF